MSQLNGCNGGVIQGRVVPQVLEYGSRGKNNSS